jgi:ABC-type multidrug transport system fused ATPase/permease subunit
MDNNYKKPNGQQQYGEQQYGQQQYGQQPQFQQYPPPQAPMLNTGQTESIGSLIPKKEDRFKPTSEYKDVWAAILYFFSVAAFAALSYFGISKLLSVANQNNSAPNDGTQIFPGAGAMAGIIATAVFVGMGLCILYFMAMRQFTGKMIKISMVLTVVVNVIGVLFLLYLRNV